MQQRRVVIIGAGMGGLVLAQALARAGDDVAVYDSDTDVASTGGYRLHLNALACAALRRHLSPELFTAIRASSASPGAFRRSPSPTIACVSWPSTSMTSAWSGC